MKSRATKAWPPLPVVHTLADRITAAVRDLMDQQYYGSLDEGQVEAVEDVLIGAIDSGLGDAWQRAAQ